MLNFLSKISLQSVAWINPQSRIDHTYKELLFTTSLENEIRELAQECDRHDLTVDTLSEISVRLSPEKIAITHQHAAFCNIHKQDFQITALQSALSPNPFSCCRHIRWHALVYQYTPAKYTLFCQPVHAMVFANRGSMPDLAAFPDLLNENRYTTVTTPDESSFIAAIKNFQVVLLKGYGLMVWADDIHELLPKVKMLEFSSKIALIGDQQGERECQN